METLESSRVCRLCGQHSGIAINIFDETENHVRKINAVLPIMVHEMDLLPKQMCHRCSYKLEEFHKFYVDCLKTDTALKSQLSWMRKGRGREKIGVPMVHIENVKIKAEPLDYDVYELEPLVENIDYINSMSSMTFPPNGIHDGLTYAAFSRCRCCCDRQDQSRSRRASAELRQDYKRPLSKHDGTLADGSRRNTFKNDIRETTRLKPVRRNVFSQAVFPDCPQNHLPRVIGDAQDRLATTSSFDNEVSLAETRKQSHGKLNELPENRATSPSTIVRNLRPRRNLVNYASIRSGILDDTQQPSAKNELDGFDSKARMNFRQIKMDLEARARLRPRKKVDYQESKKPKESEHRTKKRKIDTAKEQSSRSQHITDIADLKIKQEVLDSVGDTIHDVATSARTRLQSKRAGIANLETKIEPSDIDDKVHLQKEMMCCLKLKQSRARGKFQLAEKNSLASTLGSKLARRKKNRFPVENYSPKCLRSQDTHLRNGKMRRNEYVERSARRRSQTRKAMDAVNKCTKKVPAMLKLPDGIKRYCETCNVSFMNKELFKLHACYND